MSRARQATNAEEHDLPPLRIDDIGAPGAIDAVDGPMPMSGLELEAFMNEDVEIYVHESNDENAGPFEYCGVEGRRQFIARGKKQIIKRKYVERLARARKTTFTQDLTPKDETLNTVRPHSAPMIPFSVITDTDKGKAWLDKILNEPLH